MTGGLNVTTNVTSGYRRLHALNGCASEADRIRWIIDVPGASGTYALGPPTVSRGVVFVGTNSGRLVVIADPSIYPGARGGAAVTRTFPLPLAWRADFTLFPSRRFLPMSHLMARY